MGLTLLVDAPSLVYRALFSTPDTVRTRAGEPINAAYGFLGMLARLVAGQHPDELACADDAAWRPEWRGRPGGAHQPPPPPPRRPPPARPGGPPAPPPPPPRPP